MAVSGVIWVPSEGNIGENPGEYATELEIYARSLPGTYGQSEVEFLYAQPAQSLVEGVIVPDIPGARSVTFEQWPKSLKDIAVELAQLAQRSE